MTLIFIAVKLTAMKYMITLCIILAFASCKKDYKCTCTDKDNGVVSTSNYKSSKSDLSKYTLLCTAQAASYDVQYPNRAPVTCALK